MAMGKESLWALKPGTNSSSSCPVTGTLVEQFEQFCIAKLLSVAIDEYSRYSESSVMNC